MTLLSFSHCWITTATGAFSPAYEIGSSPFQQLVENFQNENITEPLIIEDARQNPLCAHHPGVVGRPKMRFFFGVPLISRGHLLGTFHLWDSKIIRSPPQEKITQLKQLAADALATLQRDMFEFLEANSPEEAASMELPAVWLDLSTPRWQIMGANSQWEKLTGVSVSTMSKCQGLLDIMTPRDEPSLLRAMAATERRSGVSVAVIISPCSQSSSTLQFALALKPVFDALPRGISTSPVAAAAGADIWKAEVHAWIQASSFSSPSCKSLLANFRGMVAADSNNSTPSTSASSPLPPTPGPSLMPHTGGRAKVTSTDSSGPSTVIMSPLASVAGSSEVIVPPRLETLQLGPLLGCGSYGSVYLGTLQGLPVAIKMIHIPEGPQS